MTWAWLAAIFGSLLEDHDLADDLGLDDDRDDDRDHNEDEDRD